MKKNFFFLNYQSFSFIGFTIEIFGFTNFVRWKSELQRKSFKNLCLKFLEENYRKDRFKLLRNPIGK